MNLSLVLAAVAPTLLPSQRPRTEPIAVFAPREPAEDPPPPPVFTQSRGVGSRPSAPLSQRCVSEEKEAARSSQVNGGFTSDSFDTKSPFPSSVRRLLTRFQLQTEPRLGRRRPVPRSISTCCAHPGAHRWSSVIPARDAVIPTGGLIGGLWCWRSGFVKKRNEQNPQMNRRAQMRRIC